jgi:predicted ATPase
LNGYVPIALRSDGQAGGTGRRKGEVMNNKLLESLQLTGFLSFSPESEPIALTNLNVLIGPNGVGKSNFIEAIELLHATPSDFSGVIRLGGTPNDWIWHGGAGATFARIEALSSPVNSTPELRYAIEFTESAGRLEIVDEVLEDAKKTDLRAKDVRFYYRFQRGHPAINVNETVESSEGFRLQYKKRKLKRESIDPQQSILSQRKDPDLYPEVTATGKRFAGIQVFREWSFGRSAALRAAQPSNLPTDVLLPQLVNLGLVLNDLEHRNEWTRFNDLMQKFLPRFKRLSTKVSAGSVQVYLHEEGMSVPVPATRLSDGTLRFLALLAILLNPQSASLICVEEPELGLHPDAMSLLADLLVEAAAKTQVIVTTHSDVLVSALTEEADSVLVCDYLENGTEMHRLEGAKLNHWLEKYRLGEVWRLGKLGGNLW